ncbi:transposable element Tcb2 transposase [Trichonephila clavipes]|nr:transposable element Tcb2 transposase [Trichonephila clavipes]
MPLCHFRRQYEQLSRFERGRIIGMMKAGWPARRVARHLDRSDCVVRRCWDQWIREGSERPRQTSRREDLYMVRNACLHPTASSTVIQAQVAPSLGAPVSSRTIRRRLAEGHLGSRCPLRVLPLTRTQRRLKWCHARGNRAAAEFFSDKFRFNLSSDDKRIRLWRPLGERLNSAFSLQRHTASTAGVMVWGAIAHNTQSSVVLIRGTMEV